jgi:hypothetical protein
MALRVCFRQMRQHIEDNEDMKLQDIVDLLIDTFEAAAPAEPTGYDDFEGFRSSQRRLSRKKKRKSTGEVASSDDNGKGPSNTTKKKRQSRLSEKYVVEKDAEDDIWAIPQDEQSTKFNRRKTTSNPPAEGNHVESSGAKKKKLRDRMQDGDQSQSQSQETDRRSSELDDIHTALESLKTGKSKSRRASGKKPIRTLSDERVVESDEEEPPANEVHEADEDALDLKKLANYTAPGGLEADEDIMDLDKLETYTGAGGPEADDGIMDLDKLETYTGAGGPEAEDDDSLFQSDEEESSLQHHDDESVDLDGVRTITTNGVHDENEGFESDLQDAESVDLDIPVQTNYERRGTKSKRSASPAPSEDEPTKVNGFANGHVEEEEQVSSDDDDMSDIPAKVAPKIIEPQKIKTKSKKRRMGFR